MNFWRSVDEGKRCNICLFLFGSNDDKVNAGDQKLAHKGCWFEQESKRLNKLLRETEVDRDDLLHLNEQTQKALVDCEAQRVALVTENRALLKRSCTQRHKKTWANWRERWGARRQWCAACARSRRQSTRR